MKGFIEFIRNQGVVGLAIGFIVGGAISSLVASLVTDIINPIVGIILGDFGDLSTLSFHVGSAVVTYGKFISGLINFIILCAVVYTVFIVLRLNKLDKKKEDVVIVKKQ